MERRSQSFSSVDAGRVSEGDVIEIVFGLSKSDHGFGAGAGIVNENPLGERENGPDFSTLSLESI